MRILIADSSAVVRAIIEQNLKKHPGFEIAASVSNGKKAVAIARDDVPDAIISGVDTSDFLEQENLLLLSDKLHIPVLLLSEGNAWERAASFAVILDKPKLNAYTSAFFDSLVKTLEKIAASPARKSSPSVEGKGEFKILCIGASTGGPSAVSEVLSGLGKDFPLPILYAQHIEIGADKAMAGWFSSVCNNVRVKLAEDGEIAQAGTVYMAPADRHLIIDYLKSNGRPVLHLSDEEPERFLRPAVNKLFRSAAKFYGRNVLAVLLTGMGADGAEGCKEICDKGGWTIVEDKSTCAVFGMPAAAIDLGAAKEVLPRGSIAARILEIVCR